MTCVVIKILVAPKGRGRPPFPPMPVSATAQKRTITHQYGMYWYSEEGPGLAAAQPRLLFAVPNDGRTVGLQCTMRSVVRRAA